MATISRLSVSLTANTSGLQRGLKKAGGIVKGFTSRIFSLKSAIVGALGVGSLGALAASSVAAFRVQEQAVAKLDASIVSMGRTTIGLSSKLQELASQIQQEGILGDEALLEGASFLTTYGKISDQMLPRTMRVMADLAAKMGGDTTRAANLLGKASMGLVGSLSIAGISLSEQTKNSKNFRDILREIEEQVGGTNKALGATATGGITQFKNAFGDLVKENLGEVLAKGISPFLRQLAVDMGNIAIDADKLGKQFHQWIRETVTGFSWIADAVVGLQIAWKTLQALGSGALVSLLGVAKGFATVINSLIGVPDLVSPEQMNQLNDFFDNQVENVNTLKNEIAALAQTQFTNPASASFAREAEDFFAKVDKNENRIRNLEVEKKTPGDSPDLKGILHRLEVNTGGNKESKEQTSLLRDIRNIMGPFASRPASAG